MRKKIALVLALVMVLMMLAACGDEGVPYVPNNNSGSVGDNIATLPGGNDEPGTTLPNTTLPGGMQSNQTQPENVRQFDTSAETDEVAVLRENGCLLIISPVTFVDNEMIFNVTLENPTDRGVFFSTRTSVMNGTVVEPYGSVYAEAGKTESAAFGLDTRELRMCGLFSLNKLELNLEIYDDVDYATETLTVVLKEKNAGRFELDLETYYAEVIEANAMNFDLVHAEKMDLEVYGVKVLNQALVKNEYGVDQLMMEVYNTNSRSVYIDWLVTAVNGLQNSGGGDGCAVPAGCRAVLVWDTSWEYDENKREAFGIKSLAKVDYTINVYDEDYESEEIESSLIVPGEKATLDMSATVIYDVDGVKISAKKAVGNEYATYIYLIFENNGATDYYVEQDNNDITIDGTAESVWANLPYAMWEDDFRIGEVTMINVEAEMITIPCTLVEYYSDEVVEIQLVIDLG